MDLTISTIVGGPGWSKFQAWIGPVKREILKKAKGTPPERGGHIEFVFQVPGRVFQPDFKGERTGKFSQTAKRLQIQIAVPKSQVQNADPRPYIFSSLRRAIALAEKTFVQAGIDFENKPYLELVQEVEKLKLTPLPRPTENPEVARILREFEAKEEAAAENLANRRKE